LGSEIRRVFGSENGSGSEIRRVFGSENRSGSESRRVLVVRMDRVVRSEGFW
jgi:hypothetical protein